jgi:cyclopropane-fatty-acyl-phospholipid synthase
MQAAYRGAKVHTITLSKEQKALAEERIAKAGLSNLITVEIRDYRDLEAQYDAVVSVEMIEAVGEKYWPTYFDAISKHLRSGGRFGLQAITMPHDRLLASKHAYTWIHKYIFPGGIIPSREVIDMYTKPTMQLVDSRSIQMGYAETLRLWREKFMENQSKVRALGFDEEFERMWQYYLAYSEAGFRAGHLDVWQLGFIKK